MVSGVLRNQYMKECLHQKNQQKKDSKKQLKPPVPLDFKAINVADNWKRKGKK